MEGLNFLSIPDFNSLGLLPVGVYDCSVQEFEDIFANLPNKDIRRELYNKLIELITSIKRTDIPCYHLLIDGSYVTNKEEPSDIDIAIICDSEFSNMDVSQDQLEVLNSDIIKEKYGFNMFQVFYESESLRNIIEFYQEMEYPNDHLQKGILRVRI
jgi:predicted nucleotidyltransferase